MNKNPRAINSFFKINNQVINGITNNKILISHVYHLLLCC